MKKIFIALLILISVSSLRLCAFSLYAQEKERITVLTKQIMGAKSNTDIYASFEELKDLYFKENKYSEFVDLVKSLEPKKKAIEPFANYYIALSRYSQLKYLENKQLWDEYFSQGNTYRDQLTSSCKKAIDKSSAKESVNIYSRLILWQFHKDQQDAFVENSLNDLINAVQEYSKAEGDISLIKLVADKLLSYSEKGKAKGLYSLYADGLISKGANDDSIKEEALSFYKEGNPDLSEILFDAYIAKIKKTKNKEESIPALIDTAQLFCYKDQGLCDPAYAEKVFKQIEALGGQEAFGQDLIYLRAFNLEKMKDFASAKDVYIELIRRFPGSGYNDEVNLKIGLIYAYALRDIISARIYFGSLIKDETKQSPQIFCAFYQLGLLSQWQEDYALAKGYFSKLIEKSNGSFKETVDMAKERLKEIEEQKPLDYNLKTFLNLSLQSNFAAFDMSKVDLKIQPYLPKKEQEVNITSNSNISPSGCTQVELQYLWSGDLGLLKPENDQAAFNTSYSDPGTKAVFLVVVTASGTVDRSFNMLDIK